MKPFSEKILPVLVTSFFLTTLLACDSQNATTPEASETEQTYADDDSLASMAEEGGESSAVASTSEMTASEDGEPIILSGPVVSMRAEPCTMSGGEESRVFVSITDQERNPLELTEPVRYQWQAPEGWRVDGDTQPVTVVAPADVDAGLYDVGVSIEDGTEQQMVGNIRITIVE